MSSNELIAVHLDSAGRLWAGTKGRGLDQLLRLDEGTGQSAFRNYSKDDGLPDETIWGIRSDTEGHLWLATSAGLARLNPESGLVKTYSTSHGLQSHEFNLGAHYASSSGELFFGGVHGFNAFFPQRMQVRSEPPPVVLTSFSQGQPAGAPGASARGRRRDRAGAPRLLLLLRARCPGLHGARPRIGIGTSSRASTPTGSSSVTGGA